MDKATSDRLRSQLIRLGDMMGDGLHHEPDGKWIEKEYKAVCRALGYIKPTPRNTARNNESAARMAEQPCPKCGGALKQTRSGSLRLACGSCNARFQIKRKRKGA